MNSVKILTSYFLLIISISDYFNVFFNNEKTQFKKTVAYSFFFLRIKYWGENNTLNIKWGSMQPRSAFYSAVKLSTINTFFRLLILNRIPRILWTIKKTNNVARQINHHRFQYGKIAKNWILSDLLHPPKPKRDYTSKQ
jgi:hypothetical protein